MSFEGDPAQGQLVDPTFEMIPSEEKANRIVNLESNVLEADPRIKRTRGTQYQELHSREWLWTLGSKRVLGSAQSSASLATSAVAESEGSSQMGHESLAETHYYDLDWGLVARNAAQNALRLLGAKPVPSTRCHVLFSNRVTHDLLRLLAQALSGDNVAQGLSFLKEDLGKTCFSPQVTLIDDPHYRKRLGTCFWDAEGTETSRLDLVQQGRVLAFAHNLRSARQLKTRSTGSAVRGSERFAPVVGFHNLSMEPGKKDFVDLLREMGRGFVVYELIGVHTANPVTGDFSFGAAGTWVENGEETKAVGGVALAGNVKELFSRIVSVGRDHRWTGSVAAPSVLCDNVSLAGEG
jgi:PmbA protein